MDLFLYQVSGKLYSEVFRCQTQLSPLKRTLKDPMFDRLFLKATDMIISALANPTKASVFYLDPSNCKFRFSGLKDFIVNNI